jgi:peptide/nickel transport system permease protein
MVRYAIGRAGQAVLVLVGLSLIAFLLIHLVPGDPVRLVLGPRAPAANVRALTHQLGLDRPWPQQYWNYLSGLLHGDLGRSITQSIPVADVVAPRLPVSLLLIAYGLVVATVVAVPAAVFSALHKNRTADHVLRVGSTTTATMPTFWLGLFLVLVFSIRLGWFPVSGYGDTFASHIYHLTLPAIAVGLSVAPLIMRVLRASMVEALGSDYVEAARARGLSSTRVTVRHALRNSALAPLTILGILVSVLLSGTVIAESVFALPGLGSLLVTSVVARDYPTVQALVLIFGVVVVAVNVVTDLIYPVLDRRVVL